VDSELELEVEGVGLEFAELEVLALESSSSCNDPLIRELDNCSRGMPTDCFSNSRIVLEASLGDF
jgi:hypothetical protein